MAVYTQQEYQSLVRSISLGVTKVQYGNKITEYRSLNEMLRIKSEMEADLGISTFGNRKRLVSHSKGIK